MCTVTFIARRSGYVLGMNRDEKLSRASGLPPQEITHRGGRGILSPSEPGGGTWIGVNDVGVTLALINWYAIPSRVMGEAWSRGWVVRDALPSDSAAALGAVLRRLPLARVNPFRLIAVFPVERAVVEWRWDRRELGSCDRPWRAGTWISSGFDEPGAQRARGSVFEARWRRTSSHGADWLRRLHRSHRPERGPYSVCMHRDDAATVSYTEVTVSRREATLAYTPGAPCCTPSLPAIHLPLRAVPAGLRTQGPAVSIAQGVRAKRIPV
ncbi:MAG TPA: hypothetical protein DCM86_05935 [Verrucomicrobiales bacterium]|nr:hypothetical protein [Verrucomicrobiales bacterium]